MPEDTTFHQFFPQVLHFIIELLRDKVFGYTRRWNGRQPVITAEIHISLPFDPGADSIEPEKKEYVGIWDTGASGSVITQKIVNELNLLPTGKVTVYTASGKTIADTYLVNVYLPNKVSFIGVKVSLGQIQGADMLIGMDIIGTGDFAITNCNSETWMTFRVPSIERIDFVQEINDHNQKYKHVFAPESEKKRIRNRMKRERKKRR